MDWLVAMMVSIAATLLIVPIEPLSMPLFGVEFNQLDNGIKGGMYLALAGFYTTLIHAIGRIAYRWIFKERKKSSK